MMEDKGDIDVSLIEEFNDIINNLERVNLIMIKLIMVSIDSLKSILTIKLL